MPLHLMDFSVQSDHQQHSEISDLLIFSVNRIFGYNASMGSCFKFNPPAQTIALTPYRKNIPQHLQSFRYQNQYFLGHFHSQFTYQ